MNTRLKLPSLLALFCFAVPTLNGADTETGKTPADYVYMYLGSINPKNRGTMPIIKLPAGNISLFPNLSPAMEDMYLEDHITGFPLGFANLMANTGKVQLGIGANTSAFSHDSEIATPYSYQALLEDPNINTEFTLTSNTIVFRFTLPEKETSNLLLDMLGNATFEVKDNKIIQGSATGGGGGGRRGGGGGARGPRYFYMELSMPAAACGTWQNGAITADSRSGSGARVGLYLSYPTAARSETVEVKIGLSPTSIDEAHSFVTGEIGSMSFDEVKAKARDLWNNELNLIRIKGGSEKERSLFYTTLYRTRSLRMGNVWDTYRCAYPLQTLIKPQDTLKAIQGFVRTYEQSGWLPSSGAMIGNHSTAVILDAYMKGVRDFDVEKAYEGMRKNAMEATMIPWKDAGHITELEQCYFDKGYYPALPVREDFGIRPAPTPDAIFSRMPYQIQWLPEPGVKESVPEVDSWHRRQSVSVTLEHCYDDWCLAQFSKILGKDTDYQMFMKRAHNYTNLFDASIGFMAPKTADGKWVRPFDPVRSGGFAGEAYFAECNAWIYTWNVQHDVQGLIDLMGGRDRFIAKLDELFVAPHTGLDKLAFEGQFPDMTGLIGMYCQGNEPAFHIPYLFNYGGQPWKTQSRVRQIMELWYDTTPFGLAGDEDGGAMSSWYVFTSMGFYPQCPGRPIFDIGSPLFDETTINVGGGKEFVVEAKNVSAANKYIQSATLNGQPLNKPWFNYATVIQGGRLVLQMGPVPNKSWGSAIEDAPPSMSSPSGP